ncbi:polysaccharide pyruvyl transferase family protein [Microbacterium sp. JZ31]|uniref:polysaccharide pyruvyl transferase family protein n=1 Tax=Microbacterium sp. JZ31 TaxID=1906274 RepID=UPI001931AAC0|nr:polysaccharide pyruvyl transferase family protein [Microbacterium sp. JZ31]
MRSLFRKRAAPKHALWITCGVRGNAGDALLYEVTRKLFDGVIDLDFRYVSEPKYLKVGDRDHENVVIGPGGMFVQTHSSRHLHSKLQKQWGRFEGKTFHLWSTGILGRPTDEEVESVRRVTSRSRSIVVRATKESEFIREIAGVESEWAPCASLFTDRLLKVKKRKHDVVVVNLDDFLFTEQNVADHPLRRFVAFAESQGLEVRSMINAGGDSNRRMLDLIPVIDQDRDLLEDFLREEPAGREFNEGFNAALAKYPGFGHRYTGGRFAFGKRLHGWLPFMAFDAPAAFIGMQARRGMPRDYFGDDDFLCAVPRRRDMSRDELDRMADAMIGKLEFFIKNEDALSSRIAGRREELWEQLKSQSLDFASRLV